MIALTRPAALRRRHGLRFVALRREISPAEIRMITPSAARRRWLRCVAGRWFRRHWREVDRRRRHGNVAAAPDAGRMIDRMLRVAGCRWRHDRTAADLQAGDKSNPGDGDLRGRL